MDHEAQNRHQYRLFLRITRERLKRIQLLRYPLVPAENTAPNGESTDQEVVIVVAQYYVQPWEPESRNRQLKIATVSTIPFISAVYGHSHEFDRLWVVVMPDWMRWFREISDDNEIKRLVNEP